MLQKERTDENTGHAAQQHIAQRAPGNVAAGDLRRNQDQLDRRREHQSDAHRNRSRHAEKQDQDRHSNRPRAHAGERDEQCDEESDNVLHFWSSVAALLDYFAGAA
jgi:hypothetical protein